MKKRPFLSEALKAGIENQEDIAKQFGIPSSSLRNWLKRNSYPERFLSSLAKFAGLPTSLEQLAEEFDFNLTRPKRGRAVGTPTSPEGHLGLLGIFRRFELQAQSFAKMQRKFGIEVQEFFSAMGPGDVFCYVSLNLEPLEWGPPGWLLVGNLVQRAVKLGAHFIYFLPDVATRKWAQGLGLRSMAEDWDTGWNRFHKNIKNGSDSVAQRELDERVHKIECKLNSFMVPDHKYTLFICKKPQRDMKSFVLLPTDTVNPFHLPLHGGFTDIFYTSILGTVQTQKPSIMNIFVP